jgi:hypothetical protein
VKVNPINWGVFKIMNAVHRLLQFVLRLLLLFSRGSATTEPIPTHSRRPHKFPLFIAKRSLQAARRFAYPSSRHDAAITRQPGRSLRRTRAPTSHRHRSADN